MALVYILLAVSIVSAIAGYLLYVYCTQRIARRQERNLVDATDPQTNRETRIQLNINQQILNEEEHGSEERNSESHREADVSVEYTHSASRRDPKKGKSGKKETKKTGEKKGEEKKEEKVEKKEEKKREKEEKKEKSESETTTTTTTTKKESKPTDPVAAADKKDAVERERVFANFMTSSDTSLKKVMFEVPPNYDESQQQQQQKALSSTARINTISGMESSQTNKEGSDEFQPRVVTGASGQQWLCGSPTDGVHARHPATEPADNAGSGAAPAATLQSTSITMPTALLSTAKETSPRSVAGSDDGSDNELEDFTVITMSGSDTEFEQLNSY